MLSIKRGADRLAYTLKAGLSNNGCGHAGETWNPVIAQPTKLSESALPTCDGKSREHLGSHQSLFHVGRLNKHGQMSEKDRKHRNNINTLTGKKWRQADKSAQLLSGTSLFLGHWQQGAAHSETSQLSYFLVEKSPQTGPPRHSSHLYIPSSWQPTSAIPILWVFHRLCVIALWFSESRLCLWLATEGCGSAAILCLSGTVVLFIKRSQFLQVPESIGPHFHRNSWQYVKLIAYTERTLIE